MGERKKPGPLRFAASSKLGRFVFQAKRASVSSSKPVFLPVTTAQSAAGDVQEEKPSPNLVGELDSLGENQSLTEATSSCAVEGSPSGTKTMLDLQSEKPIKAEDLQSEKPSKAGVAPTMSDLQSEKPSKAEDLVSESSPSVGVAPTMSARIQKSALLTELGTPTTHVSGAPFVMIPEDNIDSAKEEFKEFVFARFPGDVPAMGRIIGVVNAIWARTGPRIFVHKIGEGTFLLKVTNARTRQALLSRQAWMIKGCPMFIAAWSPEFTPEQPQLTSAVIPVEFRGVPYLLFNNQSLSRIATAVGRHVSLAPETERKENCEVAKVWVQVNLLADLPDRIVSGFSNGREVEISVSYPWLPDKCSRCKKFGHKHQLCPSAGHEWRLIPPASKRTVPSPNRSLSWESKGRKRSRPGRSARARRCDLCRGRDDLVDAKSGPPTTQTATPNEEQESPITDTSDTMIVQKGSSEDPQLEIDAKSVESSEGKLSDQSCFMESSPKQMHRIILSSWP
ncbi:hypothetical protein DY000_02018593 [Brassica cretica]|uniref:DUF4283 domain-containing protein n=1 Tax=Brassica cretica TaxID=69181 RepID=A0ABQ7CQE8_BRACR|nr:hypothetical protein DY000_02018593 [Brassica cretica]